MKLPDAVLLLAFMLPAGEATAAEIRVFSGGAPRAALSVLVPEFERATGHRVELTYRLVSEIQGKLAAGERADVILLPVGLIAATEKAVPLRSEGRIEFARVGIGVIAREGATPPDISTAEAVRSMLLNARAIAWPEASTPVGAHLNRALAQLGIADEVRPRLIVRAAIHGGAELVAKGEADVGLYPVSEVNAARGVTLVGLLPAPLQNFVVYGSAIPASNVTPEPGLAFIDFISDPSRSAAWRNAGLEYVGRR